MGKLIDADRLKAEIEKHIKEVKDAAERFTPNIGFFDAKLSGIYDVMAIIDSLQQEQPCDTCTNDKGCVTCKDGELWEGKEQPPEDLEAEIDRLWESFADEMEGPHNLYDIYARLAHHFAEWQKSQMPIPEDTVIFQKGIEEGKRLMMEDAEEGEVASPLFGVIYIRKNIINEGYSTGDKVKIVIVPDKEG